MPEQVLVLNPGGGTTRIALYRGVEPLFEQEVVHPPQQLAAARSFPDRLALRLGAVRGAIREHRARSGDPGDLREPGGALGRLDAVVGRGGPYRPLPGGVYRVVPALVEAIAGGDVMADHPSNLGAPMALALAQQAGAPAFVVDPVCVDELAPEARIGGLPELPRRSLFHALNIKAVARRYAASVGRPLEALVLVVAHLGSGSSVALLREARAVDVNNSADEGPFSVRRAGTLPASALLEHVASTGTPPRDLVARAMREGGMAAHLGTADLAEAEGRAARGDEQARRVLEAMAWRTAGAIGARATAACGRVDAILLTGGMARSATWLDRLLPRIRWIAPVHVIPGEAEMQALAEGALRVLRGQERARTWPQGDFE